MGKERQQELKPSPFNPSESKLITTAGVTAVALTVLGAIIHTARTSAEVDSFWRIIKKSHKPQEQKRLFKVVK